MEPQMVGDEDGTADITITVSPNPPVITNLNGDNATVPLGGSAGNIDVDQDAGVTDGDSPNFNTGNLTIVQNTGTANGNFSLDGTSVTSGGDGVIVANEIIAVGGNNIGTVHATNDGQGGNNLTITFNSADATPANVQTLIQNILYAAASTPGDRTFTLTITDAFVSSGTSANNNFTITIAPPEMGVKQGSTVIADGGTFSFGTKGVNSNTDITFTVENSGLGSLSITTPIILGGADAAEFSVQQQPTSPVAGSGSTTFIVRFTPTSSGAKTANISITNSDADENPYNFDITGSGSSSPNTNNKTITINEDEVYQFVSSDIPFNDPDGDSFAAIILTAIDTTGTFLYNGTEVVNEVEYNDRSSFTFIPNSNENGIAYFSFSFKVKDENGYESEPANLQINVNSVNDAPIMLNLNGDSSWVEVGGATTLIDKGTDVSILNLETDTLNNGSLSISQFSGTSNGSFKLSGSSITNGQDVIIGGSNIGSVTSAGQDGNGLSFSFNENAAISAIESLIKSISYGALSELGDREFTITLNDGEGTANGGIASVSANIIVTLVAQPSQILVQHESDVIENGGVFIFENRELKTDTSVAFTLHNNGLGNLSISLPLSITGANSSEFVLNQQPDSIITSGTSSSILVNFNPISSGDKTASITIANNDSTNNPYVINLQGSGNTPPVGMDSEITINEDETYTFSSSDFTFNDINGDTFAGITLTSSVSAGKLLYDGSSNALSGDLVDLAKLVFIPDSNTSGTPYAEFSYKLKDSKNAYSLSSYTLTINVDPVDDAPIIVVNSGITVDEESTNAISENNLLAKDNDENSEILLYKITQAPEYGIITVGSYTESKSTFSQHDISTGKVRYIHSGSETNFDSFKFIVEDNQGNASNEETFSIIVNNINDAPVISTIPNISIDEDDKYILARSYLYQYISDSESADSILQYILAGGDNLSIENEGSSGWIIIPDENYFGITWINITVSDGAESVETRITVDVKSKNDAPVISEIPSIDILEDEELHISKSVLYGYISDLDHPDSLLTISFIAGEHIEVNRLDANNWLLTPEENYFGNSSLVLFVNDGIDTASSNIIVNIEEINDPPVVEEVPDSIAVTNDGETNFTLDFQDTDSSNDSLKVEYTHTEGITVSYDSLSHTFTVEGNEGFVGEAILTITITDNEGAVTIIEIPIAVNNRITGITQLDNGIPLEYSLDQNFPNPFNPTTKIRFGLPEISDVSLKIYDILGKEVATLVNTSLRAGYYEYYWRAVNHASGIYFYIIDVKSGKGFRKVKKMILVK